MAKDVAQRQLDQSGFRISTVGTPTAAGDATITDNTSVPKAASGAGSPGTSFLAAAADHVHPATPGMVGNCASSPYIDDRSMQEVRNESDLIWDFPVDFTKLPGDKVTFTFTAYTRAISGTGSLVLQVGGDPGQVDSSAILTIPVTNPSTEAKATTVIVAKPGSVASVKLVAMAPAADAAIRVHGKTLSIQGMPGVF